MNKDLKSEALSYKILFSTFWSKYKFVKITFKFPSFENFQESWSVAKSRCAAKSLRFELSFSFSMSQWCLYIPEIWFCSVLISFLNKIEIRNRWTRVEILTVGLTATDTLQGGFEIVLDHRWISSFNVNSFRQRAIWRGSWEAALAQGKAWKRTITCNQLFRIGFISSLSLSQQTLTVAF